MKTYTNAVLLSLVVGCGGKKKSETSALEQVDAFEEEEQTFFGECTEKQEVKAGNHFRVFDCGTLRAAYYDSPGTMTYDDVVGPISTDARSLGYMVYEDDQSVNIGEMELPLKILDHKTREVVGGDLKYTLALVLQPLEGERTRVHQCKIPAPPSPDKKAAWMDWCTDAFNEMFSYDKSAAEALMEMTMGQVVEPEDDEGEGDDGAEDEGSASLPKGVEILDD